jgi:hypothetical protein
LAAAGHLPGLTIACGQEAAGGIILQAATAFRKLHPKTPLRIAVVRGRRRIEGVANGLYDLATVTHSPGAARHIARCEIQIDLIHDDELVLACSGPGPLFGCRAHPFPEKRCRLLGTRWRRPGPQDVGAFGAGPGANFGTCMPRIRGERGPTNFEPLPGHGPALDLEWPFHQEDNPVPEQHQAVMR